LVQFRSYISKKGSVLLKKILLTAVLVGVVVLLALFACSSWRVYSGLEKDVVFSEANSSCDLSKNSCEAVFVGGESIALEIDKPLRAGENMIFNVRADGFEDEQLFVHIYGLNMNMGLFTFEFPKKADGGYGGSVLLPNCMSGKMSWKIEIISKQKALGAGFVLELL
jgi:hypothetical protein